MTARWALLPLISAQEPVPEIARTQQGSTWSAPRSIREESGVANALSLKTNLPAVRSRFRQIQAGDAVVGVVAGSRHKGVGSCLLLDGNREDGTAPLGVDLKEDHVTLERLELARGLLGIANVALIDLSDHHARSETGLRGR